MRRKILVTEFGITESMGVGGIEGGSVGFLN